MKNSLPKKKLLIISLHADPSMPPGAGEWGGTHTYMRELLTELCDSNYDVLLITRKVYQYEDDLEQITSTCRIMRLTLGEFGEFNKKELYYLHDVTFNQTIEKLKLIHYIPDIIHSVYWNSGHLALRLSQLWNIPYVHSIISSGRGRNAHGATGTAPNRIDIEELVFHNASFLLCVTESEKEEIHKYYNINYKKIVVAGQYVHPAFIYAAHDTYGNPRKSGINYKIEPQYFPSYRISHSSSCNWWNKQAFTFTGRLSLDKGLHYIVQAWFLLVKKYGESCPPLWIIGGNTSDIDEIHPQLGIDEGELKALELRGKLVWWGYLDENGTSAIYTKTLALVTHSKYEPGGRVSIEAMCEGLPVLATPNGFALDVIHNWQAGFLIDYGDVPSLAIRMEHFIKQPYLSNCMGYCAKIIGQSIISDWAFKETHIYVYNAALEHKQVYKKQQLTQPQLKFRYRKIGTYPFNMLLIDDSDILQIMLNNGIQNVESVKQIEISDASSFFWEVKTDKKSYYVKIPYDRMNLFPLWATEHVQDLVISGLKRYRAEVGARSFVGIPDLLGKDDVHHVLISEKYNPIVIPARQSLKYAIDKINQFYEDNPIDLPCDMVQINNAIEQKNDFEEIDSLYKQLVIKSLPWQNYFMDYSLRVELNRWDRYYSSLLPSQKKCISSIYNDAYKKAREISELEASLHPVISHGGCDYKNLIFTPETILLDNEKLHIGWPGIDYADLLITYVQKNYHDESYAVWRDIILTIPNTIIPHNLLIGWLLLGIIKEVISETAQLNHISQNLGIRNQILFKLLN